MATERHIYTDASPLIGLARIDRLDLLRLLPVPVRVIEVVWQEVVGVTNRPGMPGLMQERQSGLLVVVQEGNPSEFPMLDLGEASTLSAARSAGGAVLLDERRARRMLETDPRLRDRVPYLSTLALIVIAKKRGAIPEVRPILDALRRESFRMASALYEETLRAVGEWPG